MGILTTTELFIPTDLSYGWSTEFFDKYSLSGPPGVVIAQAPRREGVPSYYLNKGVTALLVPSGIPNGYAGLTPDQTFVLSGRGWYYDPISSRHGGVMIPFSQWTTADAQAAIDYWGARGTGAKYTSGDWTEDYTGNAPYYNQNPPVYEYLHKGFASLLASRNQIHFGEYGGPFLINNDLENSNMYNSLGSAQAALNFLMRDPFFFLGFYNQPGFGAVVLDYYGGVTIEHRRLYELACTHALILLSKKATGVNFPVMQYTEGVINEFMGYTAGWKMSIPGGAYLKTAGTGGSMDFGYMLTQYFWASFDVQVVTGWMDPSLFGNNRNVVQPNEVNQGGAPLVTYYPNNGTSNPIFTKPRIDYEGALGQGRGDAGGPMPSGPIGFEDAMQIAFNFAGNFVAHVGTKNWIYPTIKMNGTTYTPGPEHSFVRTTVVNNLPWCRGYRDASTGKGWVSWHYSAGTTPITVDLTINGVTMENVRMVPGAPRFIKFTSDVI